MLAAPISIWGQATRIQEWLSEWAHEHGGECRVMANMRHLWEEAVNALNTKPRLLVCFNGEVSRGGKESNWLHRVDRTWVLAVIRGHGGFTRKNLESGIGESIPFYDVLEIVRDRVRAILSISEEMPIEYRAMRPTPGFAVPGTANVFVDGYVIEFATANDIPNILESPEGN